MTQSEIETSIAYSFDTNAKSLREQLNKMSFIVNKKNRVVETQLRAELNRINKEAQNDLRMYRNEQQRFKNKYSKVDQFNEKRGSDASDVRMYETHIPGFCYRRDGASRIPNPVANNQSVDFQDLHDMLFTNSEIDIEKVMCLHLLSAHKTDSLEAPPKSYKIFLSREQSPLERLVERSKKKSPPARITRLLPTYILEVQSDNPELKDLRIKDPAKDVRLINRMIINVKILELCVTVMNALQKSNGNKMTELIELSRSSDKLKAMIGYPRLQDFLRRLSGLNLISSCESFHLSTPFKLAAITIPVTTSTGVMEELILQIRKNIFQVPSIDSWSISLSDSFTWSSETLEEVKAAAESFVKPKVDQVLGRTERRSLGTVKEEEDEAAKEDRRRSISSSQYKRRRSSRFDQDDADFERYIERTSRSLKKSPLSSSFLEEKIPMPPIREEYATHNADEFLFSEILSDAPKDKAKEKETPQPTPEEEDHSTHLRGHTNCKACLEKLLQPRPAPKSPTVRRSSTPAPDESELIKTESLHRLSAIVDSNRSKLLYYERRFSKDKENRQSLSKLRRSSISSQGSSKRSSVEIVDLDKLDLAKIRQEIKENETKKKLDNFIKNQEVINQRSSRSSGMTA